MSRLRRPSLASWVLVVLAAVIALAVFRRGAALWRADQILATVEVVSNQAAAAGGLPPRLLERHLDLLRRAERLDPAKVGIPLARGSQYLLKGSEGAAARAYERALELEPRAEIYLNLGRARLRLGEEDSAEAALRRAVAIDPKLENLVAPQLEIIEWRRARFSNEDSEGGDPEGAQDVEK